MFIREFEGENYKSIYETGRIKFSTGINMITGQNNVGKSALLKLLSLAFHNNPHRSSKTVATPISVPEKASKIVMEFYLSFEEFRTYLFESDSSQFVIEVPRLITTKETSDFHNNIISENYFREGVILNVEIVGGGIKSTYFKEPGKSVQGYWIYPINKKAKKISSFNGSHGNQGEATSIKIASQLLSRIYSFDAERLKIGSCHFGKELRLNNDASNLPEVLHNLQWDTHKFKRYNDYVKRIFPNVYWVSVRTDPNPNYQNVQIVIWNEDPKHERSDLVVPLSESGTGVGQVLAILYVVLTSDISKVIIIDEPNSFLHPGASRKLIEILKEHTQHQFIIATHSPSTISAATPKSLHIIKSENALSKIEEIDLADTQNQTFYLAEIGSKLSDVFGADDILWVEGRTEEICFPKIVEKISGLSLMGTSILGVKNTGDFEKKGAQNVFDIYTKLSKGKGLLPPAVGFVFDREDRTKQEMHDLIKQSDGKVKFTQRKMFENYLLNAKAIHSVLNSIDEISVSQESITEWISLHKWDKEFIKKKFADEKNEDKWLIEVDGAKFLETMFSELTQSKVAFEKIKHSVGLCEWIVDNDFNALIEIQEVLKGFLKH
jgi:AAA15 family ATPase/GTPase